jgi:glutamate racemase
MIGILDAGIGGLRVAREIGVQLPERDLLYFGDSAHGPYGTKAPETVERSALQGARFLMNQGAGLLVIASHCASAVAAGRIAEETGLPVIDAITPAVGEALYATRAFRIGVIGSPALIASDAYPRRIKALRPDARVAASACPLLGPLIEAGWFKKPETAMIVKKCVHGAKVRQVDTLILASSCICLLAGLIQRKVGRRVRLVDGAGAQARAVSDYLAGRPELARRMEASGRRRFVVSDLSEQARRNATLYYGRNITLEGLPGDVCRTITR